MKTILLPGTSLESSAVAYGCMKIARSWEGPLTEDDRKFALEAVAAALECGINFFDHADIYCGGKSEMAFASVWESGLASREEVILQSKCGIRFADGRTPHRYDFSYDHIVQSVEGSLRRLGTEYLDILLLHRPDILVEPEEVARAFHDLEKAGKVRHFGVSNHNPGQIELLRRSVDQPLIANQLEFSLTHTLLIDEGIVVNRTDLHPLRSEGTLDYCRLNDIGLQAWSPLCAGRLAQPADEKLKAIAAAVREEADRFAVAPEAILIAWILRHPAGWLPIIGSTNPQRIRAAVEGASVELSREDWWRLYVATRDRRIP